MKRDAAFLRGVSPMNASATPADLHSETTISATLTPIRL
jgi:hypothetical protein